MYCEDKFFPYKAVYPYIELKISFFFEHRQYLPPVSPDTHLFQISEEGKGEHFLTLIEFHSNIHNPSPLLCNIYSL